MEAKDLKDYTIFHYSDEPRKHSIEQNEAARANSQMYPEEKGLRVNDAVSDVQFRKDSVLKDVVTPTYRAQISLTKVSAISRFTIVQAIKSIIQTVSLNILFG